MPIEAGEIENRMSVNPNEFPDVSAWEDGMEYEVTAKVRQVSPGEFEIVELSGKATEQEEAEEIELGDESPAPAKPKKGRYPNPAVAGLME